MKIFVINLLRSVERRKHITEQLEKLHLEYEIFNAVDGTELTDDFLKNNVDIDAFMKRPGSIRGRKGIIGCALSHKEIYKKIIQDGIQRALIIEDDIIFNKDIVPILNKLDSIKDSIEDKELILLYTSSIKDSVTLSNFNKRYLTREYYLLYPINIENIWMAAAYSISLNSAKAFLDEYPQVSRVADVWGAQYEKGIFSTIRCVAPSPVSHGILESEINTGNPSTLKARTKSCIRNISPKLYYIMLQLNRRRHHIFKKPYIIQNKYSVLNSKKSNG